jgi:hypothetical protein
MTTLPADELPANGDVLITSENGVHLLSVVPHPHRLSFKDLSRAVTIAVQWANANDAQVWRKADGRTSRLPADRRSSSIG